MLRDEELHSILVDCRSSAKTHLLNSKKRSSYMLLTWPQVNTQLLSKFKHNYETLSVPKICFYFVNFLALHDQFIDVELVMLGVRHRVHRFSWF